jgi:hypothetical protein
LTTPPTPPTAPLLPLTPEQHASYEDLLATYQAAIENTADLELLETLNSSRANVDDVLTKDNMYRIASTTALYDALLQQIGDTNDELKKLKAQILAISSGISTFADVLSAVDKVLTLIP